jgi:ankyrin repeat protein
MGADVNARGNNGWTALHRAAFFDNVEAARCLLDMGAAVDAKNDHGSMPMHLVWRQGMARLLLDKGAGVNAKDARGWTPLSWTAEKGHVEVARFLLDEGADVDAKNDHGWTPLHIAAQKGHVEVARLLLDKGAGVDAENVHGWTPLKCVTTVTRDRNAIVLLLISHGASYNSDSVAVREAVLDAIQRAAMPHLLQEAVVGLASRMADQRKRDG